MAGAHLTLTPTQTQTQTQTQSPTPTPTQTPTPTLTLPLYLWQARAALRLSPCCSAVLAPPLLRAAQWAVRAPPDAWLTPTLTHNTDPHPNP